MSEVKNSPRCNALGLSLRYIGLNILLHGFRTGVVKEKGISGAPWTFKNSVEMALNAK